MSNFLSNDMVLTPKRPTKSKISLVTARQQTTEPSNIVAFNPNDIFSSSSEEPPEEICEPTAGDMKFIGEVLEEQYEFEEVESQQHPNNGNGHDTSNPLHLADYQASPHSLNGNGHPHTNGHHNPTEEYLEQMEQLEKQFKAEQIIEQAAEIFATLKYVYFTSRSKGRYHSGKKFGQQRSRRNWKEVELASRGVEPSHFIGKGYRHRVFWPVSRFPWDEVADGIGMDEQKLMHLLSTLTHNARQAKRYLRTGMTPDYRRVGLVNY